jgi:signal transduction histidine kinase/CheY-like chemotaxis protein
MCAPVAQIFATSGHNRASTPQAQLRLTGEQATAMAGNGYKGAGNGYLVAVAMGAILLWIEPAPPAQVWAWLLVLGGAYAVHILLAWRFRAQAQPPETWAAWCRRFMWVGLAEGALWSVGIVWFSATGTMETELVILVLAGAIAAGVGLSFGSYMPAFWARFLPATVPYVIWAGFFARQHRSLHEVMAACVATFILGNLQLVRGVNTSFVAVQEAKFRNLDLAEELRAQKEAAEAATLAKSRFLAAASHDLRQPVHGLSLFVGALHGAALPAATAALLEQIEASVVAIDGLFAALLDISRLDAGVVRAESAAFPIQRLLARVVRDHEPDAARKGIAIRLVPCAAMVETDPALFERVVRNLVSNAVRYTDRGCVLLGCRRRGGRVRLEVWDTGRGIPPEARGLVFDEFAQVQVAGAERGPGLGLGLAIVRRLSDLLGLAVALCSEPGRGSCFSVSVAVAAGVPVAETPVAATAVGRVLVVDDDPAIRAAMAALLSSWGHVVVSAGSAAEVAGLALTPAPDLVICDYHLRGGADGLGVIAAVRGRAGRQVPAALITADTSADVLAAAADAGLLVMHKPVPNGRLRAAISRLLASAR